MKTLFSNSKKWLIFRYLCLIYLFLCGLALIDAHIFDKMDLTFYLSYGLLLLLPIVLLGFLIYSIIVAIRTKLKTPRSKLLIGICAFILIATFIRFLFYFDNQEVPCDFWFDLWLELAFMYPYIFHIVLFLYVLSFNIYSLCTKFSPKGSKVYFFASLASVVLLLCIGGVAYFNNSKDYNSAIQSDYQFDEEQCASVEEAFEKKLKEEAFEQKLKELDSLRRMQDHIDFIPEFDEIVIPSEE